MWVLPKSIFIETEDIPLDTFRQSMLLKGKVASEKTWISCIKKKSPNFLLTNCTTSNPKNLALLTKALLLNTHTQVKKFCNVPEDVFVQWVKGIRQEYNSARNPKPKIKPTKWGTPTAFDEHGVERKDLDRLLKHVQVGGRKKRTSSGNLVEQVESTEVEFVYTKVAEYHSQKRNIPLKDFVVEALKLKGYLGYFEFQNEIVNKEFKGHLNPRWVEYLMGVPMGWTNAKITKTYQFHNEKKEIIKPTTNAWSTPTSTQRGNSLMNYLLKNIRYLKAGKQTFAPSLGEIVEAEHYGIDTAKFFKTIDLSLDQVTIKQIIRKEYMGL